MKFALILLAIVTLIPGVNAKASPPGPQQPAEQQPPPGAGATSEAPRQEKVETPQAPEAPAVEAQRMEPAQVSDLLHKVYNAAYRISDLLSALQSEKWRMEEAARQPFDQTMKSLSVQLKTLEEWRSQFASQPRNLTLANATDATIRSILPSLEAVTQAVSQYENPASAAQYKQAGDQLLNLDQSLEAYMNFLRAGTERPRQATPAKQNQPAPNLPPAASRPPQTEELSAPQKALPPATSTETAESVTPQQIKTLMDQIYAATFRLQDVLTLVHPEHWKVPEPVRNSFERDLAKLRDHVRALETSRARFAEETDSPYLAYHVYVALPPVVSDLSHVAQNVSQFEDSAVGTQVGQPGKWLQDAQQTLQSYLELMLDRKQQMVRAYETDLAACQNTLNYAMRRQAAQPMRPIQFARPLQSARIERRKAKEAAARAATPTTKRSGAPATGADTKSGATTSKQ